MTVLITGARGGVGAGLLRRLCTAGHDVRAASRAPEMLELPADVPADVPAVALDLADPATFGPALAGVTDVFLYAEPAGIDDLVAAAVDAGVRRVVLLSSNSVGLPDAQSNPLARHHLDVERALLGTPLVSTLLRPGAFASNALGWAVPSAPAAPSSRPTRTPAIHPEDIADVAELALTTDRLDGQAVALGGPETLSFRDQAAILGELLGRPVEQRELTEDQARERMGEHMPASVVTALLDYWADALKRPTAAQDDARRITGRPARTFCRWASDNLAAFR
jgi:uncharacterized protein YbjT (DUF2867 family)